MDNKLFDARRNKPKKGQVLARFRAIAEFVEGEVKRDVITALEKGRIESACKILQKLCCALEYESYKVCRQISEDLLNGMSPQEIEYKPYEYIYEALYYANKEDVPKEAGWSVIGPVPDKVSFKDSDGNECVISCVPQVSV